MSTFPMTPGSEEAPKTQPNKIIDREILSSSKLPFLISLTSISMIFAVYVMQNTIFREKLAARRQFQNYFEEFLISNSLFILLFIVCIVSAYVGYRLTVAAGATTTPVIPQQDYALLAPLVSEGKTEAIDQYVRLSSLAKFTGSFTQLGLTGLPLATIFLTLFFSMMTIFRPSTFLDLTKLTLGAFIGSFVQRQVERRIDSEKPLGAGSLKETKTPTQAA